MTARTRKTLVVLLVISTVLVLSLFAVTQFLVPSLQKTSTSSQNPLDQLSNPFSSTYSNPFDTGSGNKEYKNPFDSLR